MEHLDKGTKTNDHGHAALFIDEESGQHSLIRSVNWYDIKTMLSVKDDWTRVFIHQRASTRGGNGLENTHFWQSGRYFYCHNGVFRGELQSDFLVDSMVIGHLLSENGLWPTLEYMQAQEYSNVFIIDMESMEWYMSRSRTNTLFTDSSGNYSTKKLGDYIPVQQFTVVKYELEEPVVDSWWERTHQQRITQTVVDDDDTAYNKLVNLSMGIGDDK